MLECKILFFTAEAQLSVHCLADSVNLQAVDHLDILALVDHGRSTGLVFQHIVLDHLDTVQTEGVRGVARANYTSTSTIMRLARKMNYSGFVDMCYKLRSFTETPHQTMQEEEDFLNGFSTQSLLH